MNYNVYFLIFLLLSCTSSVVYNIHHQNFYKPDKHHHHTPTPKTPILSTNKTLIYNSTDSRKSNIQIALSKINNFVLLPHKEFSFNRVIGPRTIDNGFLPAPEFIAGTKINGIGGGVCQVSSTLYGAAIKGWLDITKRYSHSRPVNYSAPGTDAAVSYGNLDLVFSNPYPVPLTIRAVLENNEILISLEGISSDFVVEHNYKSGFLKDFSVKEIPSKFISNRKRLQTGQPGASGTSIWIKKVDGEEIDRKVFVSSYKPILEIWLVPAE